MPIFSRWTLERLGFVQFLLLISLLKHGRPQNSFLDRANHILDRAKGHLKHFMVKFLSKLAILYLKFQKCQFPGPGKCQVLPIGADAHVLKKSKNFIQKWISIIIQSFIANP